ncbi:uncharacterized protein LOC126355547 [Schistocerca gregaria]|uniref:uncharacterized protein LOC126355547 n=1 Tax=Schistocerca gregaria TaxID=7010 RepID=UPI00211E3FEB|nr:uncharacterized protein LOC126355547 [Schistocerca gregaria]
MILLNLILPKVSAQREVALTVITSGISVTLLEGQRTAHTVHKLPLDILRHSVHKGVIEALDITLRNIRGNKNMMGDSGIPLCRLSRNDATHRKVYVCDTCVRNSFLWRQVQKVLLKQNMGVFLWDDTAEMFLEQLLAAGEEKMPVNTTGTVHLTSSLRTVVTSTAELIDGYPDIVNNFHIMQWLGEKAILAPSNDTVKDVNSYRIYVVGAAVDVNKAILFLAEFLNSLDPARLPPHCVALKVGTPITFL